MGREVAAERAGVVLPSAHSRPEGTQVSANITLIAQVSPPPYSTRFFNRDSGSLATGAVVVAA